MSNEVAHPNQWYTPVYVRVYRISDDAFINEKYFSDLQMAWIWVKNTVNEGLEEPNFLRSFDNTVQRLGISAESDRGVICAEKGDLEYCVFYEQ